MNRSRTGFVQKSDLSLSVLENSHKPLGDYTSGWTLSDDGLSGKPTSLLSRGEVEN